MPLAQEDVELSELDRRSALVLSDCLDHEEAVVAVLLELRALVPLLRVLDRRSRQVERRPRLLEFLRARVSQRHPHVPGTLLCAAPRLIEVQRVIILARSVHVVGAVGDQ